MAYITLTQLVERFDEQELIDLTDVERLGEINLEVLTAAISDASAIVDSYLISAGYDVPLQQSVVDSGPFARYCSDIVRYLLMDDGPTDTASDRYSAAMRWLRDLSAGKVSLGLVVAPASSPGMVVGTGRSNTPWDKY